MKGRSFFTHRNGLLLAGVILIFLMTSCSSQSNQPNPATPEGRFELAKREFSAARFDKALDYTDKLLRDTPQHELAPSARMLQMTIHGGLAEGCRQIGKAFADGRMMTRDVRVKNDFRNRAFDYYRRQKAYLLNFVESFEKYAKTLDKTKPITYQGTYPAAESAPRIFLEKVKKGMTIGPEDEQRDQQQELKNGVLTILTRLAGLDEDRAKAKAVFAEGTVTVDPADFLFAVAKTLHEQGALFDRLQLNEYLNFKAFCDRANATATQSVDLLKSKGDKKKIDEATRLKKDCEALVKQMKK